MALFKNLGYTQMCLDMVWMAWDTSFVKSHYKVDFLFSLFMSEELVDFLSNNLWFPFWIHPIL